MESFSNVVGPLHSSIGPGAAAGSEVKPDAKSSPAEPAIGKSIAARFKAAAGDEAPQTAISARRHVAHKNKRNAGTVKVKGDKPSFRKNNGHPTKKRSTKSGEICARSSHAARLLLPHAELASPLLGAIGISSKALTVLKQVQLPSSVKGKHLGIKGGGAKCLRPDNFYTGSCHDLVPQTEQVDLTVTSPPYDKIRDYHGYDLDLQRLGQQLYAVTSEGGVACLIMQDGTKDFQKSMTTFRTAVAWADCGWKLWETIIYSRHGKPGAWWNTRLRVDHEYILVFFKGDRPRVFHKPMVPAKHAGRIRGGTQCQTDGRTVPIGWKTQAATKCKGTIWHYTSSGSEGNKIKLRHPATMPDALAADLITCFSDQGDLVLDPMMGSGTTCIQAALMGRQYLGFDISPEYVAVAEEGLSRALSTASNND